MLPIDRDPISEKELKYKVGGKSEPKAGSLELGRENGDHFFIITQPYTIIGVFDGSMERAGVASKLVRDKIGLKLEKLTGLESLESLQKAIEIAIYEVNDELVKLNSKEINNPLVSTATVAALWENPLGETSLIVSWVGDSDLITFDPYDLSPSKISKRTVPDRVGKSRTLSQCLGLDNIEVHTKTLSVYPSERIMLSTKGFYEVIDDYECAELLKDPKNSGSQLALRLIDYAKSKELKTLKSFSDMTVVIIDIPQYPKCKITKREDINVNSEVTLNVTTNSAVPLFEGGWVIRSINGESIVAVKEINGKSVSRLVTLKEVYKWNSNDPDCIKDCTNPEELFGLLARIGIIRNDERSKIYNSKQQIQYAKIAIYYNGSLDVITSAKELRNKVQEFQIAYRESKDKEINDKKKGLFGFLKR